MTAFASGAHRRTLALLALEKCNLSCAHCCVESEPARTVSLPWSVAERLISEAATSGFHHISISGGEPFLHIRFLRNALSHAHRLGLTASITTNGYWGATQRADTLVAELRDLGLTALTISTSEFHQRFVPSAVLRNAATIALAAGLKTRISVVTTSRFSTDDAAQAFVDMSPAPDVVVMKCIPAGRAAEDVSPEAFLVTSGIPVGSCARFFTKLVVTTSGDAFPCCSPGGLTTPLRLGNVQVSSIEQLHEAAATSSLMQLLEHLGPSFFVPFIETITGEVLSAQKFVDQCHLCNVIMSNERYAAIVRTVSESIDENFWLRLSVAATRTAADDETSDERR